MKTKQLNNCTTKEIKAIFFAEGNQYVSYKIQVNNVDKWHDFLIKLDSRNNVLYLDIFKHRISVFIDKNETLETNIEYLMADSLNYIKNNYKLIMH